MRADRFRIRKTSAENATLTLTVGRIVEIVDSDGGPTGLIYIHDGITPGGIAMSVTHGTKIGASAPDGSVVGDFSTQRYLQTDEGSTRILNEWVFVGTVGTSSGWITYA